MSLSVPASADTGLAVSVLADTGLAETVLIVGDSISAAYGMEPSLGWVALLQRRLQQRGYPHQVVNASISGETTSGGRARLPELLARHQPQLVVLELGGNDGLRGTPLRAIEANLAQLIEAARDTGAAVLLLGMRIPPNYGPRYSRGFEQLFVAVGERYQVPTVPFLLEGVAGDSRLMQVDGIHPQAAAQPQLLELVWPKLWPLLAPQELLPPLTPPQEASPVQSRSQTAG